MANKQTITITTNHIESMYPKTMKDPISAGQRKLYDTLFGLPSDDKNFEEKQESPEEEYIWVEGYKGTDKDMKCRGYQYELNKQFNMPDDAEIEVCDSGFHLCPKLEQVFRYYGVTDGNRFFKVMALIPKKQTKPFWNGWAGYVNPDKYAAKSIIFLSECTPIEVLNAKYGEEKIRDLTDDEIMDVYTNGDIALGEIKKRKVIAELVALGYSEDIAKITFENDREYLARALAKQTNISWDTRILALITSNLDD